MLKIYGGGIEKLTEKGICVVGISINDYLNCLDLRVYCEKDQEKERLIQIIEETVDTELIRVVFTDQKTEEV